MSTYYGQNDLANTHRRKLECEAEQQRLADVVLSCLHGSTGPFAMLVAGTQNSGWSGAKLRLKPQQ